MRAFLAVTSSHRRVDVRGGRYLLAFGLGAITLT